ncbi:uncharacterized protein NPIL_350771 [Nephila pilipes]|uniref:C2H2-type domain-containing protein n=1 Tax=Nephila pilipes TaxID=299642 RepID=A0A8X6UE61_NEPPI|nr:uncharacterized protein NPIL_350771 [Nephila pilipes]
MDNTCFLCDKSFSTASNLRQHARLTHNIENKVSTCRQIKCNVCSEELVFTKALLYHVESAHYIAIEKETKKFDTYEAFKIWKEDVEKQTTALYVKNTGSKFNNMKKTKYFYCHRNAFYNARGDKKRTIKMADSNKINGNCPSKMKVCEDKENQVYVEFTKTHLGHGKDLGRMQITREEKDELARKLEKKIPIETISDEIRDSFIDKLERIHFITRKDLLNLKAEYTISSEDIIDTNDAVEAYKVVRCLLIETDEEAFSMMLKEVLKIFSEKDELREFGKYFEHMYSKRTEVWAYYYRKWLGINTNMHIESMHRTINRNLNEINSAVPGDEELSVHSPTVDKEEMVICEDRKFLEKAVLVDNLRATAARKNFKRKARS